MSIEDQIETTLSSRGAIKEEIALWASLQDHPGFLLMQKLQRQNVDTWRNKYELAEISGMDDLLAGEHNRAMIAATRFNVEFVPNRIKELREALDLYDIQLKTEREFKQGDDYAR